MAASIFGVDAYQEYIARRRAREAAKSAPQPVTPRPPVSNPPRDPQRLQYEWSKPWWYTLYLTDLIEYHGGRFLDEHFEQSGVSSILGEALALAMTVIVAAIGTFGLIFSWAAIAMTAPVWLPLWCGWRLWAKRR